MDDVCAIAGELDEGSEEGAPPTLAQRWVRFTAAELEEQPDPVRFVWHNRIPLGRVGVLAASGGSGKTALVTGLAIHRALGWAFLGQATAQGTTVIVSTEDNREDYLRKIAAWREWMPDLNRHLPEIAEHLQLLDLAGFPFKLVRCDYGDYIPTGNVELLAAAIESRAPAANLVVIETTSRVGAGEDNPALSALIVACEKLAELTKAAVLLVAHVSQEAGRKATGDQYAPRGGSAIGDNGRFTITLTGIGDHLEELLPGVSLAPQQAKELSILRVPKINAAPKQDPLVLQIVPTRWGLVLREYDPGHIQSAEERKRTTQRTIGEGLRDLAQRMEQLGSPLTSSKLSEGLFKEIPGLKKNEVGRAVLAAVEAGLLRQAPRDGRGGGMNLLPGELRESSSQEASNAPD